MSSEQQSSLTQLESRVLELEQQIISGNNDERRNLAALQLQVLDKLKALRDALTTDGADNDKLKQEKEALTEENKKLKEVIEKQNYRINHLIKSLVEEAKNKQLTSK